MSEEKKRCHSIMSSEFEKSLKKAGHEIAKKILKEIEKLEFDENHPDQLAAGIKSAELAHGKMLNKVSDSIYSLEPNIHIRALANVIQSDGVKVYLWLWGGAHETYNSEIKADSLHTKEMNSTKKYGEEVKEHITEMSAKLSKEKVSDNIQAMRENKKGNKKHVKPKGS